MNSIAASNHSNSLLSFRAQFEAGKTRVVSEWLELRGFNTLIEERPFSERSRRTPSEPGIAFCGVDSAEARAALEAAGFGLVVEAGLGAGTLFFSQHRIAHPAGFEKRQLDLGQADRPRKSSFPANLAYVPLSEDGTDDCGLVGLTSRTIAVPLVGLIAACLVVAEVLRPLHGGTSLELLSVST